MWPSLLVYSSLFIPKEQERVSGAETRPKILTLLLAVDGGAYGCLQGGKRMKREIEEGGGSGGKRGSVHFNGN